MVLLMPSCYCGSLKSFQECCEPYLERRQLVPSAEALMRSRYSAFCVKNIKYIFETCAPELRERFDLAGNEAWAKQAKFVGLKILESREAGDSGFVKFQARFQMNGKQYVHEESSTFCRLDGHWYFLKGE